MLSEAPYRDVVFLGAGASRAAGLPAANEKARYELESLQVSPTAIEAIDEDIAWLKDIQARLPPIPQQAIGVGKG